MRYFLDTNTAIDLFKARGRVAEHLRAKKPRDEARSAARIRAGLEAQGSPIGPYDVLIAATALANGGVLVTRNTRELSRVEGLRVEDWY